MCRVNSLWGNPISSRQSYFQAFRNSFLRLAILPWHKWLWSQSFPLQGNDIVVLYDTFKNLKLNECSTSVSNWVMKSCVKGSKPLVTASKHNPPKRRQLQRRCIWLCFQLFRIFSKLFQILCENFGYTLECHLSRDFDNFPNCQHMITTQKLLWF